MLLLKIIEVFSNRFVGFIESSMTVILYDFLEHYLDSFSQKINDVNDPLRRKESGCLNHNSDLPKGIQVR